MYPIKRLEKIDDIEEIQSIEQRVWNMSPIPIHQTYTASKNGGILLGAYDSEEMIGFLYSFAGFKKGQAYLCSHILGILPDYQKDGLGQKMKEVQRQIAIEDGYDLIVWTFDPMESVNAYLNLHKLKAIGVACSENHYGTMQDSMNQGLPTDRFLIEWWIDSNHARNYTQPSTPIEELLETKTGPDGFSVITQEYAYKVTEGYDHYSVPIPDNFQLLKEKQPALAYEWRMKTREIFKGLFSSGYVAVDVKRRRDDKVSTYIFSKRDALL